MLDGCATEIVRHGSSVFSTMVCGYIINDDDVYYLQHYLTRQSRENGGMRRMTGVVQAAKKSTVTQIITFYDCDGQKNLTIPRKDRLGLQRNRNRKLLTKRFTPTRQLRIGK